MKQRFSNIFDFKAKKRGTPVVVTVLTAILVSGLLVACQTEIVPVASVSGAQSLSTSPDVTDTAAVTQSAVPSLTTTQSKNLTLNDLVGLLGLTKEELLGKIPEKPVTVDEGGLGFDKAGIRVWFDQKTYTKVAQVLVMTNKIDINGIKLGDSYNDFKAKFGTPISDSNGDAHFKYGDVYLSVVRDTSSDKVIAFYVLAENF